MDKLLLGPGFLGTSATFLSDSTLVIVIITAVMFTVGWILAMRRKYRAHRQLQTTAVTLNTVVVLGTMISSYWINIIPGIPHKLAEGSYAITTLHALVGIASLVMGVFVVLRGYNLVPKKLRFKNYKPFMRTTYALYMVATLLGVIVYIYVFIGNPK
jgi:uncharacterized membrane protein YozB (DUF420 family)